VNRDSLRPGLAVERAWAAAGPARLGYDFTTCRVENWASGLRFHESSTAGLGMRRSRDNTERVILDAATGCWQGQGGLHARHHRGITEPSTPCCGHGRDRPDTCT